MTIVCKSIPRLSLTEDCQTFVFRHSIIVLRTIVGVTIVKYYFSASSTIHFSSRSWSGLSQSNCTQKELMKYYMTIVTQSMPSFSLNDDYHTFVFHHSIIVQYPIVGSLIVEHYFSGRITINLSPRSWYGLSQSNIILEELVKYYMTTVCQLIPRLSLNG